VLYLNLDTAVTGTDQFIAAGSPSLQSLLTEVAQSVSVRGRTLYEMWPTQQMSFLGSGSDYTAFIQHIGVATIQIRFTPEDNQYQAVYHSNYDSYYWSSHYSENISDPYVYHAALSRAFGLLALDFVDSPILSFDFVQYADAIRRSIDQIVIIAPSLNYSNINNAVNELRAAAIEVQQNITGNEGLLAQRAINDRLMLTERFFLGDATLSGREWYRHVIFTPSLNNSYASDSFPVIHDAIAQQRLAYAQFLTDRIAQLLSGAAKYLSNSLSTLKFN